MGKKSNFVRKCDVMEHFGYFSWIQRPKILRGISCKTGGSFLVVYLCNFSILAVSIKNKFYIQRITTINKKLPITVNFCAKEKFTVSDAVTAVTAHQ